MGHVKFFRPTTGPILAPLFLMSLAFTSGAHALCIFGTIKDEIPDYKNAYWKSSEQTPAESVKKVIERCSSEAQAGKKRMAEIYVQLCTQGHLSGDNMSYAQQIRSNPYYQEKLLGKKSWETSISGSTEDIFRKLATGNNNPEAFKEPVSSMLRKTECGVPGHGLTKRRHTGMPLSLNA